MNNDDIPPSQKPHIWPPPIKRDAFISHELFDKSIAKQIKKRWYYLAMTMFFIWLSVHEYRNHGGFTVTDHTMIDWPGTVYFAWATVNAWILTFRVNNSHIPR